MSETLHRLKARVGSMKAVSTLMLVLLGAALALDLRLLLSALRNPSDPQPVSIQSIVDAEIDVGQFVMVSGYAKYDRGYPVYLNGRILATYFFLLDDESRYLIVIKANSDTFRERLSQNATVVGMTREASARLREYIEADLPAIHASGYQTTAMIFIEENAQPPDAFATFSTAVVLLLCMLPCLAVFLFPSQVFVPMPVDTIWHRMQDTVVSHAVRAHGRFFRLGGRSPTVQFSGRARRLKNIRVNIKPFGERKLLIYPFPKPCAPGSNRSPRSAQRDRQKEVQQWTIVIDESNFIDTEPGMLYGWQDRWAIRLRYSTGRAKPESLLLTFDNAVAQTECVERIRELGFTVGMWIA